jgi:cadmium resistance protein CadD (predicted permease)
MHWLSVLGRAIVAFAATNIDDIFILTLFFAQKNLRRWQVVVGQYLGLAGLIAISLVGYFARLFIPKSWIGLLACYRLQSASKS